MLGIEKDGYGSVVDSLHCLLFNQYLLILCSVVQYGCLLVFSRILEVPPHLLLLSRLIFSRNVEDLHFQIIPLSVNSVLRLVLETYFVSIPLFSDPPLLCSYERCETVVDSDLVEQLHLKSLHILVYIE